MLKPFIDRYMKDIKEKMEKFDKRWSVISDEDVEASFVKFKTRILNVMKDIDSYISKESVTEFCQYCGIREYWHPNRFGGAEWNTQIFEKLENETDNIEFIKLLEIIFALGIQDGVTSMYASGRDSLLLRKELLTGIAKAIRYSNVDVVFLEKNDEVIFHKAGESILDNKLVEYPLSFLNEKSGKHFIDALNF